MTNRPNIFDYATSELSQDAFLCWLIEWANKKYENRNITLHKIATDLINKIFSLNKKNSIEISEVKIKKQYKHIDIFIEVNNKYAIIIEDKVNSPIKENQINSYYEKILDENKFNKENILTIFFKPHNDFEITQRKLDENNFLHKVLTRKELLLLLEPVLNEKELYLNITYDFYFYLKNIEENSNAYLSLNFEDWSIDAWKGFYSDIQTRINLVGWNYTTAGYGAAEGFLALYWHWIWDKTYNQGSLYLQIEQDTLCIKHEFDGDNYDLIRDVKFGLHEKIMNFSKKYDVIEVYRPSTMRVGKWITLAIIRAKNMHNYMVFENNEINMEKTIYVLKEVENLLDEVTKK